MEAIGEKILECENCGTKDGYLMRPVYVKMHYTQAGEWIQTQEVQLICIRCLVYEGGEGRVEVTIEEVAQEILDVGLRYSGQVQEALPILQEFAETVRRKERERCAEVIENYYPGCADVILELGSKLHPYVGPLHEDAICLECGFSAWDREKHKSNACTEPCDTRDGACACGAWHKGEDWV